ncbi:MAG: magnesium/cobalt transporter CorA [Myxococcota bacterium]
MKRRKQRRDRGQTKVGLPPGSAVYVGHPREGGADLTALVYDAQGLEEHQHSSPEVLRGLVASNRVVWINVDGVHDVELVTDLCERFGLSPLAVEDVLNTATRTKLDVLDNGTALVALEMLTAQLPHDSNGDGEHDVPWEVCSEHVSVVLGAGFVLSFQEGHAGDLFEPVRTRIRAGTGRIRTQGADYLAHALLDAIVDGYFVVLDRIDDRVEEVEANTLSGDQPDVAARVYALKQDLATVRRVVFGLREVVGRLIKGEVRLVGRPIEPFFRDLYDHVMSVLEMTESGRERLTGVLDLHLALSAHRMNDVMKVLTIVATIFIPISWIAGVYGMNFVMMPGSQAWWGFPVAVGLMLLTAIGMLVFFRLRRWL